MSSEDFFASPQGAAVMKHALLRGYIQLFVNKLGSTHPTVHYLDGYAGPGVYGDGSDGSPKLAVEVAALVEDIRDLRCTFVEKEGKHAVALAELLAVELPEATVIHGDLRDHVDDIAVACDKHPLLAFIDPFGLGLTFDQLNRLADRTNKKTDIIMNVSLSALRRVGGHLTADGSSPAYLKARETMLANYDATMGGDWWRGIFLDCQRTETGDAAVMIAKEYARRCQDVRGGYFLAAVKDRWDGPPAYMLLLLAGHEDAFWNFNEFMSLAYDQLRDLDAQGQLLDYNAEYPSILEANIRNSLKEAGSGVLHGMMSDIYGELLGIARGKHLRPVLKKLAKEGVISTTSKNTKGAIVHAGQGDLQRMRLKWSGG